MSSSVTTIFGEKKDTSINIPQLFLKYVRYWYLFVLSTVLTVAAAYWYLRYVTPVYQTSAVLLIKNQPKSTSDEILSQVEASQSSKIVENEIELLKSRSLMLRVVDDLNLSVSYFMERNRRSDQELYSASPIRIYPSKLNDDAYGQPLYVKILNKETYELLDKNGTAKGRFAFSQNVKNEYGIFRVFFRDSLYRNDASQVKVLFSTREEVAQHYKSAIKVDLVNQKSTVLKIMLEDPMPDKAKAIIGKLLEAYTFTTLADKNRESTNTLQFIDERLRLITNELDDVERNVESYKSTKGITDLNVEGNLFLGAVKDNDARLNEIEIQIEKLNGVENYLKSDQVNTPLTTLSVTDPILIELLANLNGLQVQQEKYSHTMQPDNPFLQTLMAQIKNTKGAIQENVSNQRKNLFVTRSSLQLINNRFESSMRSIPKKEREFVSIKRQQGIKESLYLLLLQKKEETAISYASTVTDSRLVDDAYSPPYPIRPNTNSIYLIAFLAGLLIPIVGISIRNMLNDKVQSKKEIERETGLAVFGEIMNDQKSAKNGVPAGQGNSVLTEQFRMLRANLQYATSGLTAESDNGQVILITSSVSGEGKSFISANLASSLSMLDKRVVMIELDLRKPKLSTYMGFTDGRRWGVSNYLIGQSEIADLMKPVPDNSNLYLIPSGPIPPNPSELLSNGRIRLLLSMLRKQFDYIIIDTPPIEVVADATLLASAVDVAFYVVRQNFTHKNHLEQLEKLKVSQKFKSMNVIFNGVDYQSNPKYKYAYKYV